MLNVRNLAWLRSLQIEGIPDAGARLHEIISDMAKGMNTLEQQTNSNFNGNPAPPPPLQAVTVTPTSVGHHVSINHAGDYYRGTTYHVESADNPHFSNPFPTYTGPGREIDLATGNQKLYFQAFASYPNSGNTTPVFHGGTTPTAVTGGVATARGTSQGSGTGRPGGGLSGYGPVPYTGSKPPTRANTK
jgi:hypothetical protein